MCAQDSIPYAALTPMLSSISGVMSTQSFAPKTATKLNRSKIMAKIWPLIEMELDAELI
jgi:hypothetical protein